MRRCLLPALLLAALGTGCLPTFEDAECYADLDCPQNLVCVATVCTPPARDAGFLDAAAPDAEIDAGFPDAAAPDADPPDMGFMDATPDAGFPDAEPPDMGFMDATTPDAGFDVRLEPADIDFGVVRQGCAVPPRQVNLLNSGPTAVEITSILPAQGTSGEFMVIGPNTPFMLASGGSEPIEVRYGPQNVGVDTGDLEVTWGAPPQLLSTGLRAEGVISPTRTERFTQTGGPLDVLFVVHDTSGMTPFQSQLASDLTFLMLTLAYEGWDYQIGVTTADLSATGAQGALLGTPPFVTAQTANVETELAMRLTLGTAGATSVQGLEAARLALSPPLSSTGANMGFLRPDAALLLFFVGNADDASSMNVSAYSTFFEGLKGMGNADRVAANVIVSEATSCSVGGGGNATYAGRYLGLAPLTGGIIEHICDSNYQDSMTTMPPIDRNQAFVLAAVPDPTSITVRVDGSVVPQAGNWSYDAMQNAIVFTVATAPALGLEVQVDYTIACN